jgi:aminopeptidase
MIEETEYGLFPPDVAARREAVTQVKTLLRETPFDPAFLPGARNAIENCLRIQPNEKVTLITDRACLEIGAALAAELERLGLNYHAFVLEDLSPRPWRTCPPKSWPIWKPATSASSR